MTAGVEPLTSMAPHPRLFGPFELTERVNCRIGAERSNVKDEPRSQRRGSCSQTIWIPTLQFWLGNDSTRRAAVSVGSGALFGAIATRTIGSSERAVRAGNSSTGSLGTH